MREVRETIVSLDEPPPHIFPQRYEHATDEAQEQAWHATQLAMDIDIPPTEVPMPASVPIRAPILSV